MPTSRFRSILDKLFPGSDGTAETSQFVQEALRSLRMVRDQHALLMGATKRVPSRYELRISAGQFDNLSAMRALRDLESFLTDQMMKELSAGKMRTFGDHVLRVSIACDDALTSGELFTAMLSPEANAVTSNATGRAPLQPFPYAANAEDATRILGDNNSSGPMLIQPQPSRARRWRVVVELNGGMVANTEAEIGLWIIGRRGGSGKPLPPNCRKLDLDVRETISREQLRVEFQEEWIVVEQIGKGKAMVGENDPLRPGVPRTLLPGVAIYLEEYTIRFIQ